MLHVLISNGMPRGSNDSQRNIDVFTVLLQNGLLQMVFKLTSLHAHL